MGRKTGLIVALLMSITGWSEAQDFIIQGCYWSCPEDEPGSLPDSYTLSFWTDRMAEQASELSHAGFTHLWLPGLTPEAPGPVKQLLRALQAEGIAPIAEISGREASYRSLEGYTRRMQDSLGVHAFSSEATARLSPAAYARALQQIHQEAEQPPMLVSGHEQFDAAGRLTAWLVQVLKQLPPEEQSALRPRIYDYQLREALRRACTDSTYDVRRIFQSSVRDQSSVSGYHLVTLVNHPAYKNQNGVTGDRDDVIEDPLLAYVYLLTNNQIGLPTVYYGDYYGSESELEGYLEKDPMQQQIEQLIRAHRDYIYNSTSIEYLNQPGTSKRSKVLSGDSTRALVFQIDGNSTPAGLANVPAGGKDVLVGINFGNDTLQLVQELNSSNLQNGDFFTDILGLSMDQKAALIAFDSSAQKKEAVLLRLPPRSYSIWVQGRAKPVVPSLVSLTADAHADYIELTWEAAFERNVLGYEIERSVSGKPFERIHSIRALGSGDNAASYLYIDEDVFPNEALRYRVKVLDAKGGYEHSPEEESRLAERKLNFELLESERRWEKAIRVISTYRGKAELSVFDAKGKEVFRETKKLERGENLTYVNLSELPSGVYFISFSTENQRQWSTKIVKL